MEDKYINPAARHITGIVIRDGKDTSYYMVGNEIEMKGAKGHLMPLSIIRAIIEVSEQTSNKPEAHLIYLVLDQFDNVLAKLHAGIGKLEIICNPT